MGRRHSTGFDSNVFAIPTSYNLGHFPILLFVEMGEWKKKARFFILYYSLNILTCS
jgi:hypothetical protein